MSEQYGTRIAGDISTVPPTEEKTQGETRRDPYVMDSTKPATKQAFVRCVWTQI